MNGAGTVAITGMSVITPLGDSVPALCEALEAGRRAIEPSAEVPGSGEARLRDFDATRYANVRGMRVYNRGTQMGIAAAKLALTDAGLEPAVIGTTPTPGGGASLDPLKLGVVTALTYGHMDTLIEYDRSLISVGVQRTNPALMPLGIPNAPGSAIALSYQAKAFSITLSDGGASGLEALALAARLLASGRASVCLVVSVFSRAQELLVSAQRAGMLAPEGAFNVFDRDARGTAFGEVAAALVLERAADAQARGAALESTAPALRDGSVIKGLVLGHGSAFALEPAQVERALARACGAALRQAGVLPGQLALIVAGANGQPERDAAEARALLSALGAAAAQPVLGAVKANLGESLDASGLLQAIAALCALARGKAPKIAGLSQPAVPGLRYALETSALESGPALLTATSPSGACSALVLASGA
jgi:3-oxoacyl-[acyl-carrier-protein] synthase II